MIESLHSSLSESVNSSREVLLKKKQQQQQQKTSISTGHGSYSGKGCNVNGFWA